MKDFIEVNIVTGELALIVKDVIYYIVDRGAYREIHTTHGLFNVTQAYDELKNRLTKQSVLN